MKGAYAQNTYNTHANQRAQYEKFCRRNELQLWTDKSLVLWIFWAADVAGVKKATLKAKLEAFKFFARHEQGRGDDAKSYGSVWHLLTRWIARRPDDATPKRHVGKQVLERAIAAWREQEGSTAVRQLATWYSVSLRGLLRAGEAQAMRWEDMRFEGQTPTRLPKTMMVTLRTEAQRGEGDGLFKTHAGSIELLFERRRDDKNTCAVQHTYEWWRLCGQPATGKVFKCSEEHARKTLQWLAHWQTGEPAASFGLHSLRSGGATDMETRGMSLSQIKHLGRWRSTAVLLYLRGGEVAAREMGARKGGALCSRNAL